MDISTGLIAKAGAGTAALAATTTTGVIYGDDIVELFVNSKEIAVVNSSSNAELNKKLIPLNLPDGCKFDESNEAKKEKDCDKLNDDKLKAINFDGKEGTVSQTINNADKVSLKIEKTEDRDIFPDGIKIIFKNEEAITSKDGGNKLNIDWKKNTNPEYKIDEGKLKLAWDVSKLAGKIGLTCSGNNSGECTVFSGAINVLVKEGKKIMGTTPNKGEAKIKFEKDQKGYNQGIRFQIEGADVNLTQTPNTAKEGSLPVGATYEIKQETDGWFLKRVWDVGRFFTTVGLANCTSNSGEKTCTLNKDETLNINDGTNKVTDAKVGVSGGKIKVEVVKNDKYNLGFKLTVAEEISLSGGNPPIDSSISSLANDGTEYEMKFESNKWFLTKVVTTATRT